MQQELQLKSNCKQKDLFRNSNWKKFVQIIFTNAPYCIAHFVISFPLSVSGVIENVQQKHRKIFLFPVLQLPTHRLPIKCSSQSDSIRRHFDIDYPRWSKGDARETFA